MTANTTPPNFDIAIGAARAGEHPLRVIASPAGESETEWQALPADDDFRNQVAFLQLGLARPDDAVALGERLRAWLFPPPLWSLYQRARAEAGGAGLRLRLHLDPEDPALSQIPWEYCRDDRSFLALNGDTPLVRYQPTDRPPRPLARPTPLRLLLVTASPDGAPPLAVAEEAERIQAALAPLVEAEILSVHLAPAATRQTLRRQVRGLDPHLLHFMGHGLHTEQGEGALALVGEDGGPDLLHADQLMTLLRGSSVRLALFTACLTAVAGEDAAEEEPARPLLGLAPRLVWSGLPGVVAMQFKIGDRAAVTFSQVLYEFLAQGMPLDRAVTEARLALYLADQRRPSWGIPALFLRAPDGCLWTPLEGTGAGAEEETAPPRPRFTIRAGEMTVGKLIQGVHQEGGEPVDWSPLLSHLPGGEIDAERLEADEVTQGVRYEAGPAVPLPPGPLLGALQTQLDGLSLPAEDRRDVAAALETAASELGKASPNRARMRARLDEVRAILQATGSGPTERAFLAQLLVLRRALADETDEE